MDQIYLQNITKDELVEEIKISIIVELKKIISREDGKDFLLSRRETWELLKINESTLNRWVKSGKLTPHYLGSKVYFKRSEIPL